MSSEALSAVAAIALAATGDNAIADASAPATRRRVRVVLEEVFLCFTWRKEYSTISIQ